MQRITIVIPVNNEEKNLPILLDKLLDYAKENRFYFDIKIVNDGSQDATGVIADQYEAREERISVLHNRGPRRGMGYSLKWGTKESKTSFIIWLMGDLSDDLGTVSKIHAKIEKGYDMVIASRFMEGGSAGDLDLVKTVLSRTYSYVMSAIFGLTVHDINNAFRGFRREVFENVELKSDDFAISPEFVIKAHLQGYRIGEVPTIYKNRTLGRNKFRMIPMILRYSVLLRYRLPSL